MDKWKSVGYQVYLQGLTFTVFLEGVTIYWSKTVVLDYLFRIWRLGKGKHSRIPFGPVWVSWAGYLCLELRGQIWDGEINLWGPFWLTILQWNSAVTCMGMGYPTHSWFFCAFFWPPQHLFCNMSFVVSYDVNLCHLLPMFIVYHLYPAPNPNR